MPRRVVTPGPGREPPPALPPIAFSCAVGAVGLIGYLCAAPHVMGDGDSSELTIVLATRGLAHPTGYAAYTLLGHGFVSTLHALGAGWEWAANAWSALGAAVALALWHRFTALGLAASRVSARRAALVALLPVTLFALLPSWSAEATLAEVNSWHVAWCGLVCLVAFEWMGPGAARGALGLRRGACWGVLLGAGLAHHATSVWFAFPLTLGLARARRIGFAAALAGLACAVAVIGLAWAYVGYRSLHPAAFQWPSLVPGLAGTWQHVTAAGYRHYLGRFAPSPEQWTAFTHEVGPCLLLGLPAILALAIVSRPAERPFAFAVAIAALLQCAYALGYGVADPVVYLLPAVALGLALTPTAVARFVRSGSRRRALVVAASLVVAIATWSGVRALRRREDDLRQLDGLLRQMWEAVPLRRGFLIWDDDRSARLRGWQLLRHEHEELVIVEPRVLMDAGARARFMARVGLDPLAGAAPPAEADTDDPARIHRFAEQVAFALNRGGPDSVLVFVAAAPSLQLLPKLAAAADSTR